MKGHWSLSDCISIISTQATSMYAVLYAYSLLDTIKRSSLPSSEIQKWTAQMMNTGQASEMERYQNADILFKKNADHVFKKNADRFKINAGMFKKTRTRLKKTRTCLKKRGLLLFKKNADR